MRPDLYEQKREATPEHIRKYRQSYKQEPGAILVHHGLHDDLENIDRNLIRGKQTPASMNLGEVVKAQNLNGLADKFNDIKESQYMTHKKEPLGKNFSRDYNWPTDIKSQDFAFGVGSNRCDSAKDLLFPQNGHFEEKPVYANMYLKTHGNVAPGVQRNREYNWNTIDPNTHVFGYGEKP